MIENKANLINFLCTYAKIKFNIERRHIYAIIQNGSTTVPLLKDKARDLDIIVIIDDSYNIHQTFLQCYSTELHKKLEIRVFGYSYACEYVMTKGKFVANYCFSEVLYKSSSERKIPFPLVKNDPKVVSIIYRELNDIIKNGIVVKGNKYFYWFLLWAQDQKIGNITDDEIIYAHDNSEAVDTRKYLWLLNAIKDKYKI